MRSLPQGRAAMTVCVYNARYFYAVSLNICRVKCKCCEMNIHTVDVLLGCCAAQIGSYIPTFRGNLSVPFSRFRAACPIKMEPIGCTEMCVNNYKSALRNIPEDRRSHSHRDGSLKSPIKK